MPNLRTLPKSRLIQDAFSLSPMLPDRNSISLPRDMWATVNSRSRLLLDSFLSWWSFNLLRRRRCWCCVCRFDWRKVFGDEGSGILLEDFLEACLLFRWLGLQDSMDPVRKSKHVRTTLTSSSGVVRPFSRIIACCRCRSRYFVCWVDWRNSSRSGDVCWEIFFVCFGTSGACASSLWL